MRKSHKSLDKALAVIDITAPIIAGKSAAGIQLGSTFQDLKEVITRISYKRRGRYRGFMNDLSIWYNLHNYITLEFNLLLGKLSAIYLYSDYEGRYQEVIQIGKTTIEEAAKLLNKEVKFNDTYEVYEIVGTEGIHFTMHQETFNDSYPYCDVRQKIGGIVITMESS